MLMVIAASQCMCISECVFWLVKAHAHSDCCEAMHACFAVCVLMTVPSRLCLFVRMFALTVIAARRLKAMHVRACVCFHEQGVCSL